MPLDPSLILQGAAPLQQQPNMLAQYAQVQQVQQNRLAMHAQQQAMMLGAVKQKAAELDLSDGIQRDETHVRDRALLGAGDVRPPPGSRPRRAATGAGEVLAGAGR